MTETTPETPAVVDCVVHVRFNNDGTVSEIGERPTHLTPDAWFSLLSKSTLNAYQALAGGRGMFTIPRAEMDGLKAAGEQTS